MENPSPKEEEGKADADDETEGVKHYLAPLIVHAAVLTALARFRRKDTRCIRV